MAERDKSQGFGFVYVDLKELLAQRDEVYKHPVHPQAGTAKMINFNRDKGPLKAPQGVRATVPKPAPTAVSLKQIQENLDRLQALHHKLHAVLEELSSATERSRKK